MLDHQNNCCLNVDDKVAKNFNNQFEVSSNQFDRPV